MYGHIWKARVPVSRSYFGMSMLAVLSFMLLVSFFMLMVSFFMLRVLFFMRHCGKRSRWGVLV